MYCVFEVSSRLNCLAGKMQAVQHSHSRVLNQKLAAGPPDWSGTKPGWGPAETVDQVPLVIPIAQYFGLV